MCCQISSYETMCISSVPVFKALGQADLHLLQEVTHSHRFQKGEFIFHAGMQSKSLFVVHNGLIKLTKVSEDGKEQIVRLLFPGDFFGLFSLLKDEKHYVNAEAIEKTEICKMTKEDFLKTMETNADLSYRFLLAVSERLHEADESVGFLGLMEVEQRLARALILFHDKTNAKDGRYSLPISKRDLASYIGTTPESISRKLLSFNSQRLIQLEGKRQLRILEMDELKKIAGI